ncbi:phospholipid-transporting ATPase ABCA3-like [Amblyomma americanum]
MVGLIWYLDNIVPWGYGVPKPFYFFFSPDYWSPYRKWNIRNAALNLDPRYFEQDPKGAEPVVQLVDLSAAGKDGSDIKNVSLTIYNKQITVILGPQGCGYSTILDIITGMQLPTSGEAYVCNYDAAGISGRSWDYFSVCPDESALFDDLTVEEQLLFFSFLHQVAWSDAEHIVGVVLRTMNIEQYKDTLVSQLSPHLQRVLCVAITMCAMQQTPLLIFDEPTRLMDPKGRHEVWEVLARISRRSSVLVTTQSIEEADVLADRLIVMRKGRVVCAASPTWLKTNFDSGFFLRFTKLANFRDSDVKKVVQYHMGAVEPKRVTKLEMVFNLNDSLQHASRMARMLHYLEKRRMVLGIAFMSISSCTLEDVYISMVTANELKPKSGAGDTRAATPQVQNVDAAKEKQGAPEIKHRQPGPYAIGFRLYLLINIDAVANNIRKRLKRVRDVGTNTKIIWTPGHTGLDSGTAAAQAELDSVKQLCTARSAKAGMFSVLLALLRKRAFIWTRVWWTKPLSVGIPVASMVLLALCERHFLPRHSSLAASSFTYMPERLFDVSYGFIEADNASKKFANTVLLPHMSERSVRVFSPTTTFVERELLFWAQQSIRAYVYEYQYGASIFGDNRAFVWFNGQCPYSALLSLNMFNTALLRNITGQKGSTITLVNSPFVDKQHLDTEKFESLYGRIMLEPGLNRLGHETDLFATRNLITRVLYSFFVSLAMSFYAASHVFAPMAEWSSGLKHLQLMTGMSGGVYWLGHFLFDMLTALSSSLLLMFIIFLSHMEIPISYHLAILALFVANAFSSMPLTYLFSGLFRNPTWAFSFLALGLFLAGIVGSLGVEILQVLVQEEPTVTNSPGLFIWGLVFRWFPTYALVRGVIKVILLSRLNAICITGGKLLEEACQNAVLAVDKRITRCCEARADNQTARLLYPLEPFYESGFYEAVSMVVEGFLYMTILSLVDSQVYYSLRWYAARRFHGDEEPDEPLEQQRGPRLVAMSMDPEVEREVNLVNQVCRTKAFKDVAMVIRNMQKSIGFVAQVKILDGVSLLLNRGECIGLVGINSSGKSTLLETLVGLQVPTGGGAHTAALSLGMDLRAWLQGIGYTPDGIYEADMPALTVGELLDLMARLRGVLWRRQAILGALSLVGRLREDRMINKCSHGEMKMLLIVAAVIGVPPVLLVDEPYSDVEPLCRNDIIRMLQVLKGAQAMSIIMTSHRMSHCEVLCDRVAVMEAGKIEALGDALQMNQKYGRSYMVTLRLPPEKRFDFYFQRCLVDLMQEEFHQCNFCYNYKGQEP